VAFLFLFGIMVLIRLLLDSGST